MKFLKDNPRLSALVALVVSLFALSLMNSGTAHAGTYPCGDESFPEDVPVDVGGEIYVGLDRTVGSTEDAGFWACYGVTGGESNDFTTGVGYHSQNSGIGGAVEVVHCSPGGGCVGILDFTGAEVNPVTPSTDLPADGNSTTGTSAGVGAGTCIWVHGTMSCPLGATTGGVTVNEADLIELNTPGTGCIGVTSVCVVPNTGVGVGQDSTDTVIVDTTNPTVGRQTVDLPPVCVEVGASC